MTDVTVHVVAEKPIVDAAITVMEGAVGAHVGILYVADDEGRRRHLHLAWHNQLKDEESPSDDAFWIEPAMDELVLSDVRASAALIARRHKDNRVPYAFHVADAAFDPKGILQLGNSRGLTCATFVLLVFAHVNFQLLDAGTWDRDRSPERKKEDEEAQKFLTKQLRRVDETHADLVAKEIGCTRIRAEEVAAASGIAGHPIAFLTAQPHGRHLLALWSADAHAAERSQPAAGAPP